VKPQLTEVVIWYRLFGPVVQLRVVIAEYGESME
jgi:hypothetical protein